MHLEVFDGIWSFEGAKVIIWNTVEPFEVLEVYFARLKVVSI